MNEIKIEKVAPTEVVHLQKIATETFYETFGPSNDEENMRTYLAEGFSIGRLTEELNDGNADFFFAKLNDKVIGYLKINSGASQTELQHENALEIERIYVSKEFHGKKVGQLLYNKAIEIATKRKADFVWLGVWEENQRAIRFYKKNGFVEFDKHIFKLGGDEQTDIMMKLKL